MKVQITYTDGTEIKHHLYDVDQSPLFVNTLHPAVLVEAAKDFDKFASSYAALNFQVISVACVN